nr:MAG TPA: hypothetical protein [Caudoviricetes sp.]
MAKNNRPGGCGTLIIYALLFGIGFEVLHGFAGKLHLSLSGLLALAAIVPAALFCIWRFIVKPHHVNGWVVIAAALLGVIAAAIANAFHAPTQRVIFCGLAVPTIALILWTQINAFIRQKNGFPSDPAFGRGNTTIIINTQEELEAFAKTHQLEETIRTKVKGVTFRNDDGTDRQTILARCYPGAPVEILEYSWHGDPAYKVVSEFGQIGVLSADLAQRISSRYGDNVIFQATIDAVTGGYNGLSFGCNLCVRIFL